jgi:hypothetical protein
VPNICVSIKRSARALYGFQWMVNEKASSALKQTHTLRTSDFLSSLS